MRSELLDVLACPVCKAFPLLIVVYKVNEEEVLEGDLTCSKCGRRYPIEGGIPNLIPPERR